MSARLETAQAWTRDGFFVLRRAVSREVVTELSGICDAVLHQVRERSSAHGHTSTHVSGLLASEYFVARPEGRVRLAAYASSRAVVSLIQGLGRAGEGPPDLRDLQYFHEPSARDADGAWHRDGDGPALNSLESHGRPPTLLRYRLAFAPDDHLEYVPGSHARASTPEELRVLRGRARNGSLPSPSTRVELEPGDVCAFDAWGIHRGRYRRDRTRRTLDLLFGFGPRKPVFYLDARTFT
jgi:hypothetical protein